MPLSYIIALPLISALIGWVTNRLAIHMLFHPRTPIHFCGIKFQGLIPRRQHELAEKTAALVADELLSQHTLQAEIERIDLDPLLDKTVQNLVWNRLGPRLKKIPFVGAMVSDSLLTQLHEIASEELKNESVHLKTEIGAKAEEHLDVRRIVEERIRQFDLKKLESLVWQLASNEFRQIEWLGGILGFIIGLIQVGLLHLGLFATF